MPRPPWAVQLPGRPCDMPDSRATADGATLPSTTGFYGLANAMRCFSAQMPQGYKRTTAPMVIHFVALQGIGLGGGYLFCLTDTFYPPRGAAGFWIAAVASLTIAGAGMLA